MPVMQSLENRPEWVEWSAFGMTSVAHADDLEDHFHDADEYWLIFAGRARVSSEGSEFTIGPGDILCTRMGDDHGILEITEGPLKCFYIMDGLKGRCRPGHLHHPEDD